MSHLCLHGVADGDIPLHGEGGEGECGHVDAQILTVHKGTAPHATPDPSDQKILNMNEIFSVPSQYHITKSSIVEPFYVYRFKA